MGGRPTVAMSTCYLIFIDFCKFPAIASYTIQSGSEISAILLTVVGDGLEDQYIHIHTNGV